VTTADPTPVRGSWRLSLQELAERAGAPVERLERLVELGILAPVNTEVPFRSRAVSAERLPRRLEHRTAVTRVDGLKRGRRSGGRRSGSR
jgi:hypothetical protein